MSSMDMHKIDNDIPENFEEAIKASVAATSTGDTFQDQMIEKAIRASVKELRTSSNEVDYRTALQRAIQASIAESKRVGGGENIDGEQSQQLEWALESNLRDLQADESDPRNHTQPRSTQGKDVLSNMAGIEGEFDNRRPEFSDADMHEALILSEQSHADHVARLEKSQAEEDTILQYVERLTAFENEQTHDGPA